MASLAVALLLAPPAPADPQTTRLVGLARPPA